MTKIIKKLEVEASPEKVFAAVSTPEKWPQWATFVKQASSNSSKTHWVYEMGGMKVESDTETSEVQENKVYGFHQTGGFLKSGKNRIEIEPSKKGSAVTWTLEYELPYSFLGKIMDKLKASRQFEEGVADSLSGLKKFLER